VLARLDAMEGAPECKAWLVQWSNGDTAALAWAMDEMEAGRFGDYLRAQIRRAIEERPIPDRWRKAGEPCQ
jgi:hypothetical protein